MVGWWGLYICVAQAFYGGAEGVCHGFGGVGVHDEDFDGRHC